MAEKNKQQLEAPLLPPVPVEKNKIPAVFLVSLWGLLNAGVVAITFAILHFLNVCKDPCEQLLLFLFHSVEVTDAEAAKIDALRLGYAWCTLLQATGGTLALLLAARRRGTRRALAYVVLAAAVAEHCMYASVVGIFVTAGEGYFFAINTSVAILLCAMGDLLCFLALLVGDEE